MPGDFYFQRSLLTKNGSTELKVLNLGEMPICKRLEQKVYKIKLLRNESLALQDFQGLVSNSFTLQVR